MYACAPLASLSISHFHAVTHGTECVSASLVGSNGARLRLKDAAGQEVEKEYELVIAADGVNSTLVR